MTNVLILSAGRRVELVRAFVGALTDLGMPGKVVAVDADPLAPALRYAHRAHVVPRFDDETCLGMILDICTREKVSLVLPMIDVAVRWAVANREALEAVGATVLATSRENLDIADDKWLTYNLFRELDVPAPRSALPHQLNRAELAYPLFVKSRFANGGEWAFPARNERELEFFLDYVPDPLVQEQLPGPEITTDIAADLSGAVLAVVSRQRIQIKGGEVAKGKTIFREDITRHCLAVAKGICAIGLINIQCMLRDDEPFFTEINARVGGGIPLSIAAGALMPHLLLQRAAGWDVEVPPFGTYERGLHLTRFDESMFLAEDKVRGSTSRRL